MQVSKDRQSTRQISTQNHAISNRGTFCNFLQNSPKRRCLAYIQNRPSALRSEENRVEFLDKQFHNETLSFAHKKETELSFEIFQ